MRSGLLFLPFVSFFSAILALATDRAYASLPWIGISLWIVAGVSLVVWFILDAERIGKMFRNKGAKHGLSQGVSVVLAVLLAIGIGFITKRDRFNKSWDVTASRSNTLSAQRQRSLACPDIAPLRSRKQ